MEDKSLEDAKAFGLILPPAPVSPESAHFEVWEENWSVVTMFQRMHTQWNTTVAGYQGLKYEVLLMQGGLMDLYSVDDRVEMLEGLQTMEAAALSEFAKQAAKG